MVGVGGGGGGDGGLRVMDYMTLNLGEKEIVLSTVCGRSNGRMRDDSGGRAV